jgi:hypothetical protein
VNVGAKYYFAKKAAFDLSGNHLFTLNSEQEGGILFAVGLLPCCNRGVAECRGTRGRR